MNYDTVSALRIGLRDCSSDERPSEVIWRERPMNATRHAWIPQTLGEQIWVLYDFPSKEEREGWESGLSPRVAKWLDRKLLPFAIEQYGWQTRDANGFPTQ